jgi:hypothetical protein
MGMGDRKATAFALSLDMGRLTEAESEKLHKLKTKAQKVIGLKFLAQKWRGESALGKVTLGYRIVRIWIAC